MPSKSDFGPAIVESVEQRSAAGRAGLRAGDRILRIDGTRLRDAIDYYVLLSDDGQHEALVERGGENLRIALESGTREPGIDFESPLFGRMRACRNSCMFCFVDQLPEGLRAPLYVKDDDYRLSFLCGNFVTLTNLDEEDVGRIVGDRLSPLYVSLHSTEPAVREKLFGTRRANKALGVLSRLLEAGISIHVQLVMLKGVNDAEHLDRTLGDLHDRYGGVASIGVVPVGLSDPAALGLDDRVAYEGTSALELLEQLSPWRGQFKDAGPYAADELFFMAGIIPPESAYYDEFPQVENGIGMARLFIDSAAGLRTPTTNGATAIVTTPAGKWVLDESGVGSWGATTVSCDNTVFGSRVDVCGLLPGKDVQEALKNHRSVERALIPSVALSGTEFIDGLTLEAVERESGVLMKVVEADAVALRDELNGGELC